MATYNQQNQQVENQINVAGNVTGVDIGDVDGGIHDSTIAGRDIHQYIVNSPDEIPLSAEEQHTLLAQYRQQVIAETRYLRLEGIPLPDTDFISVIPLQYVYIHIQALEQQQSQELRRAEEQALMDSPPGAQQKRHRLDPFSLISRLGEYQYRRGQSIETGPRPTPVDPIVAIREHRHLVLLGAPGSGKSTLLRYVAHQTAKDDKGQVVLFVPLGAFALAYRQNRQLSLFEWALANAAPNDKRLQQALRQAAQDGDVIWLFDGLDETGELREETSRQISRAMNKAQIVVSSRPLDYRKTHLEQFRHFEVLPLSTANVEQFITDWLTIIAEQQGQPQAWVESCRDWLLQQLKERPRIQTLTQSPLLLTFLVILARHDPREDLPTRRSELYQRYIEELISVWEQRRNPAAMPLPKARYLWGIEGIAWYLHLSYFGRTQRSTETNDDHSPAYSPDRAFVQQQLATRLRQEPYALESIDTDQMASQIIDFWLKSGLLEERQWQQWRFLTFRHLTFQEYGVARVLQHAWQKDVGRTWRFLKPRLYLFTWHEPLSLLAEQMDTPAIDCLLHHLLRHNSPYDRTLQRDLFLAATLAGESKRVSTQVIRKIIDRLIWHMGRTMRRYYLLRLGITVLFLGGVPIAIVTLIVWLLQVPTGLAVVSIVSVLAVLLSSRTTLTLFLLPVRPWIINDNTRWRAAEALGRLGDARAVEPLLVALNDEDSNVRWKAAEALGRQGDDRAVDPLLVALNDKDSNVRWKAAEALRQLWDGALEPLLVALNDKDSNVRKAAVEALRRLGDARALELLVDILNVTSDPDLRWRAAEALGHLGDVRAVEPLLAALKEANVRWETDEVLRLLRDARNMESMLAAVDDYYSRVNTAAEALGLEDAGNMESTLAALNGYYSNMRMAAAEALGRLGDVRAIEPLLAALNDEESDVRMAATEALGRLGDIRAVEPLLAVLKEEASNMRTAAAEALGRLGDARAIEPLLAAFNDEDYLDVRWGAAFALGRLGDARAVGPLLAALNDHYSNVRGPAALALGQLGDVHAVEPLRAALKDSYSSDFVRRAAALALGQLGNSGEKILVAALKDKKFRVRWAATEALGQLGDARAVKPLLAALKNASVSQRAAEVLGNLGDAHAEDWSHTQLKKIASTIWWQIAFGIDQGMFELLSTVVNHLPVKTTIDDLYQPGQIHPKRRWRWWFATLLTATLTISLAVMTNVLSNLFTQLGQFDELQGVPLRIALVIVGIVSVILVISQLRTKDSA